MLTFPRDHESIQILFALISDINGKWHLLAILVIGDIIKIGTRIRFIIPIPQIVLIQLLCRPHIC